ncbi:right-handed parallel beta-helix repeat-containing protein [Ruegeria sp.]|uniref:right-handed parallel beta-helix repeat-containing protein n=1 Tax=Ruegeria sp. TaxID=1879320 RepID=UPI002625CAA6|nr:right-handed parallel beta-helix repeat-containing protein [Ruegeria sp.]
MNLNGASNLTIEEVVFDYTFAQGDNLWTSPFVVNNSSNISILNSTFDGDVASGLTSVDNGYGSGKALIVDGSSNITVAGNEVYDFWKGLAFGNSKDLTVQNNEIHSLRSDGMNFVDVQGVLIEGNYLHDFEGSPNSGDHPDMIQFWTNNTTEPSTDIVIRGNTFDIGQGTWTQTIFMRNIEAERGNTALYYQNVTIENNLIYNAHLHGISIGETDGLTIANNTMVYAYSDISNTSGSGGPLINVSSVSTNVTIEQNAVTKINGYNGQSGWTVQDNALIQNTDSNASGYYGDVFTDQSLNATTPYNNYIVESGSIIDVLNAGATIAHAEDSQASNTTPTPTPSPTPTPTPTPDPAPTEVVDVDPAPTDPAPAEDPAPTEDPVQVEAEPAEPTPAEPEPTDTATSDPAPAEPAPQDPVVSDSNTVDVALRPLIDDDLAMFDVDQIDGYVLDLDALSGSKALKGDAEVVQSASGQQALYLDGKKDKAELGRLKDFENTDQLSFSIDFARDTADGSVEKLLWNHQKIGVILVDDGLKVQIGNNDTHFHKGFHIEDLGLNDTEQHQVAVILDADTDRVQVIVDGVVVLDDTSRDLDIVGAGGHEWGWSLGPMWGNGFDGEIYDFRVDDEADFYDPPVVMEDTLAVFG